MTFSIYARKVFTVVGPPIANAYVTCNEGLIKSVSRSKPAGRIVEVDGPLFPALVNTHTHLEFSDLVEPLGHAGMPFVDWIGEVMKSRRQREDDQGQAAIKLGMTESLGHGVGAIGEIATLEPMAVDDIGGLDITCFRELIGFQDASVAAQAEIADRHVADFDVVTKKGPTADGGSESGDRSVSGILSVPKGSGGPTNQWNPGLSPHAPYSTNRKIIEKALTISASKKIPIAMHLAETREELELLQRHQGPFLDLLQRMGVWDQGNFPIGTTPLDYLKGFQRAFRALIIHGNFLSSRELAYISEHRQRLKLVFCPRTHQYFQHDTYPLKTILQLGLPLALGTDSRASNPDLSIWAEMENVAAMYPEVDPHEILRMGTIYGAVALGIDDLRGSIEVGKRAEFMVPNVQGSTSPFLSNLEL
ncbi:amidohydrolase family protein [Pirellulaceae bacterium]|nr:amidohydrolase family protein [Pirellulaceae bacterium]